MSFAASLKFGIGVFTRSQPDPRRVLEPFGRPADRAGVVMATTTAPRTSETFFLVPRNNTNEPMKRTFSCSCAAGFREWFYHPESH